jgi:hypothetical protein
LNGEFVEQRHEKVAKLRLKFNETICDWKEHAIGNTRAETWVIQFANPIEFFRQATGARRWREGWFERGEFIAIFSTTIAMFIDGNDPPVS